MKGLDLSRLKRIHSDDKSTTFKHEMGHEIKIAHAGLSPKMLEDLNNLPGIKNKMAEGGSIDSPTKRKDNEKGVNKASIRGGGTSEAGVELSPAFSLDKKWDAENAKAKHEQTLSELRSMPKPNIMAEGGAVDSWTKREDNEEGINRITATPGKSQAGSDVRAAKDIKNMRPEAQKALGFRDSDAQDSMDSAKRRHNTTLGEMRSMPKPNLYAEGSEDVGNDQSAPPTPGSPVTINIGQPQPLPTPSPAPNQSPTPSDTPSAPQTNVPVPAQFTPGVSNPGPEATTGYNPNNTAAQPGDAPIAPPPEPVEPVAPVAPLPPPSAGQVLTQPVSASDALAHLNDQTAKLRQDYNGGKITPETASDLFANKSTLGKIGMLFGLMVSGAGSGLSHQSNALLDLMNKELDRDLEAQKQTKSNQFNALNLAESHYKNEVANNLAQQQAAGVQSNTALTNANLSIAKVKLAKDARENAVEQMVQQRAGLIPENTPMGQRARAAANTVSNAITAQQAQRNQQVAQQIQANGQQAQQQGPDQSQTGGGYILAPGATADRIQALTGPYNPTLSESQKGAINDQYKNVQAAEASLSQIDKIFPQLRSEATATDVYGKSLSSLPVIGSMAESFLDNITGGNQQRRFKTDKDAVSGYMVNALTKLGMTPTDAESASKSFLPEDGDSDETYNNKLSRAKEKIISTAIANSPALSAAGFLKKKQ